MPRRDDEDGVKISSHYMIDRREPRFLSCDGLLWRWVHNDPVQACQSVRNTHSDARNMTECLAILRWSTSGQYLQTVDAPFVFLREFCKHLFLYIWQAIVFSFLNHRIYGPSVKLSLSHQEYLDTYDCVLAVALGGHDNVFCWLGERDLDSSRPMLQIWRLPWNDSAGTNRGTFASLIHGWLLDTLSWLVKHERDCLGTIALLSPWPSPHDLLRIEANRLCVSLDLCEA